MIDKIKLHAVIGVMYNEDKTFYVKRSDKMQNYPNVWSLLSIQFDPELIDPQNLDQVQELMEKMSNERLNGTLIKVEEYLIDGDSDHNPYNLDVYLHLYKISIPDSLELNPEYYTDSGWLTAEEYEEHNIGMKCGLCLRLWQDYAFVSGISDRPYIAREV